ncbi:MAG TPA: hypothetical protein VE032_07300 [Actinomycetota bacterium]|nr:hypothetical protein [Actinomycetota bacterium]
MKMMTKGTTLKLVAVGAIAYVLGAKAGRPRYEEIMSWLHRAKDEGSRKVQEMREVTDRPTVRPTDEAPLELPDVETSAAYPNAVRS